MSSKLLATAAAAALFVGAGSAHALTITTTDDANIMASSILGTGVTITSASYNGAAIASGTFTDGASAGIGIDTGIILTTGNAASAVGPNTSDSTSLNNGLSNGGLPVAGNDASVLEISFTTTTGNLFFNYVFASEEYTEFAGSVFNDAFFFLLNGTSASDNIALIPGTSDPVTINNVNDTVNASLFNNNDEDFGPPAFNIEYDGFTNVLTASATGLSTTAVNTITLGILDVGDFSLDSAVFIEGGTFGGVDPIDPIPVPASLPLLAAGLGLLGFMRRRKAAA